MEVTDDLIDKLAHLARLQFSAEEKESLKKDLSGMISFIDKLNELDTEGVEPLLHAGSQVNVLREDIVRGSVSREEALLNAPQKNDQFFLVTKVIKK